jgi:hypothetical protein
LPLIIKLLKDERNNTLKTTGKISKWELENFHLRKITETKKWGKYLERKFATYPCFILNTSKVSDRSNTCDNTLSST